MTHIALRRLTAVALLMSHAACTVARTIPDPAAYVTERRPVRVLLVLEDGSEESLEAPAVFQDSLVGLDADGRPGSIAVSDVRGIRVRAPSTVRSALVVGGVAVAFVAILLAAGGAGAPPDPTAEPVEDHLTRP